MESAWSLIGAEELARVANCSCTSSTASSSPPPLHEARKEQNRMIGFLLERERMVCAASIERTVSKDFEEYTNVDEEIEKEEMDIWAQDRFESTVDTQGLLTGAQRSFRPPGSEARAASLALSLAGQLLAEIALARWPAKVSTESESSSRGGAARSPAPRARSPSFAPGPWPARSKMSRGFGGLKWRLLGFGGVCGFESRARKRCKEKGSREESFEGFKGRGAGPGVGGFVGLWLSVCGGGFSSADGLAGREGTSGSQGTGLRNVRVKSNGFRGFEGVEGWLKWGRNGVEGRNRRLESSHSSLRMV
eukprot:3291677-Rhodomonas_salina.4